jgi:hypothetical protein
MLGRSLIAGRNSMGIAGVFARAKKTILRSRGRERASSQAGGLPGIVSELGDTLRSDAIPAPLRGAALRIADLLGAPEQAERVVVPPVSEQAPHAVDAAMRDAHGGVCPFTGQRAEPERETVSGGSDERGSPPEASDAIASLDAVASEVVAELVADASAAVRAPDAREAAPDTGEDDPQERASTPKVREASVSTAPTRAPSSSAQPQDATPSTPPKAASKSMAPKAATSAAPAKAATPSVAPKAKASVPPKASGAKAPKGKNEKSREEVAAKPSPAKTSGRSSKGPNGKPSGAKKKK